MTEPTIRQQLASARLGKDVEGWIQNQRDDGLSWRRISIKLRDLAQIDVTPETLRKWTQ